MYLNKALIIGNIVRDPELKSLPSGIKVTTFSLATNRVWKDQNGAKKESVDYHNVVVFGRQAEISAQYLKKGSSALVEGRMQTRSWDAPDGTKKYRTEVVADRVQFGQRAGGQAPSGGAPGQTQSSASPAPKEDDDNNIDMIEYPEGDANLEDIPF